MLNPHEKLQSWTIVFTTKVDEGIAVNLPTHLRNRKLTDIELGIDWPESVTERVDEIVEGIYPVTWND